MLRLVLPALASVTLAASALGAQVVRVLEWPAAARACYDRDGRPPRAATLVNVVPADPAFPFRGREYYPRVPDEAWRSVELLTEMLASHARARLGAGEGELPRLDSTRSEADYRGHVYVVGRRDGTVRAMAPWEIGPERAAAHMRQAYERPGVSLLLNAVDDLTRAGEPFMWPERLKGDSIVVMLRFAWPVPDGRGGHEPMPYRHAAGIAPMIVEIQRAPVPIGPRHFVLNRYPAARDSIIELPMAFTVDSTGRVVKGSVREAWPESLPRPAGRAAREHAAFVRDVTRSLEQQRYAPARVGACRLQAEVQQAFIFAYAR